MVIFGLKLNCWFCNHNSRISYFNRNSWTCPHCEQYNGFNKDGDYNKDIPEMHKKCENNPFFSTSKSKDFRKPTVLCDRCTRNQSLKIEKLSKFEPKHEETYEFELELYKEYMEKIFDLCELCKSKVKFEITKQDGILKQYLYKIGKFDYLFERNYIAKKIPNFLKNSTKIPQDKISSNDPSIIRILKSICYILLIVFSILTILFNFESQTNNIFISQFNLTEPFSMLNYNIDDINLKMNQFIPIYLILIYILSCGLLTLERRTLKSLVTILICDLTLILANYNDIYLSLNTFVKQHKFQIYMAPWLCCCIILISLVNLWNVLRLKNVPSNTSSELNRRVTSAHVIPNLNSSQSISKKSDIIRPAKFQPSSKSLFNFRTDGNGKLKASVDSSDFSSNISKNSDDDDSSSIVSGITNLYLDRSKNVVTDNFVTDHRSTMVGDSKFSFYQSDYYIRNRSCMNSKYAATQVAKSHVNKKEVFVFY